MSEETEMLVRQQRHRIRCLEMIIRGEAVSESEVNVKEVPEKFDNLAEPVVFTKGYCKSCGKWRGFVCIVDEMTYWERCPCNMSANPNDTGANKITTEDITKMYALLESKSQTRQPISEHGGEEPEREVNFKELL